MSVSVSGSNPDYTLKSVLTAQLNPVPSYEITSQTAAPSHNGGTPAPVSHNGGAATPPPPSPSTPPPSNLSAHGVGASVNHQG